MQEIHSIGAVGGTLFNGSGGGGGGVGGGGGDRRLRPHNNHQALKCPRCDSLNTKFCYYNNYNLSQPRHFCKSCRRYWTKGGVLRNVPVGGGCRKAKRSKHKHANAATETTAIGDATTAPGPSGSELKSSNSHSSSESSSLTAATNTNTSTAAMEAVSGHSSIDPKSVFQANNHDIGIFSDMGNFTSLISTANEQLQFGFESILMNQPSHDLENQQWQQSQQEVAAMSGGGLVDQTVEIRSTGNEGFGSLDWQGNTNADHQVLFDLPNTVDHAYWSQHQWDGQDQSGLY